MKMPEISVTGYAFLGFVVLFVIVWLFKWWISKSLDARFDAKKREDDEYRKEQIEDAIRQQRGLQVMTEAIAELLRHQISGNHFDEMERSQKEIEAFREENKEAILKKAAKYNLR